MQSSVLHDLESQRRKVSSSQLVARVWRAQVHWVDQTWRVFCYLCTPTLSSCGSITAWRAVERFFAEFFSFLLITSLGIILCLHLSSLTLVLYIYCLLFIFVHNSSFGDYVSFTLVCTQISQGKSNLAVILKLGLNKLVCFSTNLSFQILAFCFIQFNVSRLFIPHTYS